MSVSSSIEKEIESNTNFMYMYSLSSALFISKTKRY